MADYIDRQAAIDAVTGWLNIARNPINQSKYNDGEIAAYDTALSELKKIPSADAVEVVRCKDCTYYYYADNRIPSERGWVCANDGCYVSQNDYCSWGERKDG